ncbi:MAG: DinB family protein [Candidatus Kapaibacterium sp.]
MSLEFINRQLDFNYAFAEELVKDVPEHLMAYSPATGLENHPAFTLGHLAVATAMTIDDLGGEGELPELWNQLFMRKGPGDPTLPDSDIAKYPTKSELLSELRRQHEQLKALLLQRDFSSLSGAFEWRLSKYLPSDLDCTIFMCVAHESMHLGQLSAWRRGVGLPSALGRM